MQSIDFCAFVPGKAISLVCNGFTGDDCTPQNVLNFLGSTNNGIAPVEMVFQQIGDDNGVSIPEGMNILFGINAHLCIDVAQQWVRAPRWRSYGY